MTAGYRIAAHLSPKDLTIVDSQSQFARCVREIFARIRPRKIIETGTYFGTGTTTIIATAVRDLNLADAEFVSIEINPKNAARACENLAKSGLEVELLNGLSVPRRLLPSIEQIENDLVKNVIANDLIVDHEPENRTALYVGETDFPNLPDDLLGKTIARFDHRPDFVLLDSGGHMGLVEFQYTLDLLRGPCHIALDDIYHVKHHRSFELIKRDARFRLVAASEEKFGFCITRFDPG